MRIALIQQRASGDGTLNLNRGIRAFEKAVKAGAELVVFPELAFLPFLPQRHATA